MKTPPRTGGALEGLYKNTKESPKPMRFWRPPQTLLAQENESCWVLRR